MALQLSLQFPVLNPAAAATKNCSISLIKPIPVFIQPIIKSSTITRTTKTKKRQFTVKAARNNAAAEEEEEEKENLQSNSNNVSETQHVSSSEEPQPTNSASSDQSELGEEIKKAMKEREGRGGGGDFWSGVAEEIREIEWPAFGKVLGTTGVVLGVIAGSSVVLLTVNAVLAELSDRVFAGRGVQDFFS